MSDLRDFLERTFAAAGGVLPFDAFMAAALYDPKHGYYTAGIGEVGGERGDFATAATLSDGLGRAIARWIVEESNHHAWRGPVPVLEVGGGNGALASAVLKALGWRGRRRVRYHLVEISPVLKGLQHKRLGRAAFGRGATWHGSIGEALEACGGRALVFSNELVDAFPAKWLIREGGRWAEICVAYEAGSGLREVFRDLPSDLDPGDFSAMALTDPPVGQRIELLSSYRNWLGELASACNAGSLLTIDYGGETAEAIYRHRPGGTLRAYHRHERIEGGGIYARFGRQDLTSDVNFADLVAWGGRLGFTTVRQGTQGEFLRRYGCGADAMAEEAPGTAFRVLEQRREA